MSQSHSGKNNHMYGRSPTFYKWPYKNYQMKSSWEVKYAQYLDSISANWDYESVTFSLGFTTYTPDFVITEANSSKKFIEIKGFERPKFLLKLKLLELYFPDDFSRLEILHGEELSLILTL